ncbi:hypothetical protein [Blastococcus sp. TF02A-35]|uniref:hypothetical protein n=1 Tax=Blastococcus sp. TF02A-35 TaxID=2559612 RepID=UPI001073F6E3|nr:hypothetical protein [Blastococcus sp. TF02A_35]TFV47131.1 hypothetical protein E4P43_15695 [Blastococcus sp. TF02A_35]
MPTPDTAAQIESATRALDRELRRLRISRAGRAELVAEVREDLRSAAGDGLTPEVLLGDVETFARESVAARGWTPRPRDSWSGTATALAGGAVALVVGYLLIEALHPLLTSWVELDGRYPAAGAALAYGVLSVAGLGGALAAFARFLTGRPAVRGSVARAAVLLPVATAGGVLAAAGFGRMEGYSTAPGVVVVEVLLVALPCAGALWLSRWWALRSAATGSVRSPEPVSAG